MSLILDSEGNWVESNDSIIAHAVDSNGLYIGLIPLTSQTIHVSGPPPTPVGWFWNTGKWVKLPPTLQELKDLKWEEIKTIRIAKIDAPLETPYGVFDSYAIARSDIADSVLLANNLSALGMPVNIAFTLANNEIVNLDLTGMVTVGLMLGSKVQNVRAIATSLREAIASATLETINDIVWPE